MILVKTTRTGEVTELINSKNYQDIIDLLQKVTDELEDSGIFLIKRKFTKGSLCRIDEFASKENGWELSLVVADGWVKSVVNRNDLDE